MMTHSIVTNISSIESDDDMGLAFFKLSQIAKI